MKWRNNPDIINDIKRLREEKHKWHIIANRINLKYDLDLNSEQVRKAVYEPKETKVIDLKTEVLKSIQKETSVKDLCKRLNISNRILTATLEDLKDEGILIIEYGDSIKLCKDVISEENHYEVAWNGEKIIRFGVVSDVHMCSKWQQLTHLNTMYDIFKREGISKVYNPGDLSEGFKMRQGHEHEIFKFGADDQEEYIIKNYPSRTGIETEFITGNHDHSHIKNGGHDIGIIIARERPDMTYLGKSNAKVKLTPNCTLELNHPLDGASYALSYTLQKTIDAMSGGEKPNILLNGHHHKAFYLPYRNIHSIECGTLQAQTPWMRGKRLAAHLGGWIIEINVDEEGSITRFKSEFYPFYNAIENDY